MINPARTGVAPNYASQSHPAPRLITSFLGVTPCAIAGIFDPATFLIIQDPIAITIAIVLVFLRVSGLLWQDIKRTRTIKMGLILGLALATVSILSTTGAMPAATVLTKGWNHYLTLIFTAVKSPIHVLSLAIASLGSILTVAMRTTLITAHAIGILCQVTDLMSHAFTELFLPVASGVPRASAAITVGLLVTILATMATSPTLSVLAARTKSTLFPISTVVTSLFAGAREIHCGARRDLSTTLMATMMLPRVKGALMPSADEARRNGHDKRDNLDPDYRTGFWVLVIIGTLEVLALVFIVHRLCQRVLSRRGTMAAIVTFHPPGDAPAAVIQAAVEDSSSDDGSELVGLTDMLSDAEEARARASGVIAAHD